MNEENEVAMENFMDQIRDDVLERLSPVEIAAVFGNLKEFIYRYREQENIKKAESQYE